MPSVPETPAEVLAAVAKTLGWDVGACRGRTCGAKIYWAKSAKTGNAVPIDASCGLNHFITCPERARFRRTA